MNCKWKALIGGFFLGTAGVRILSSRDAKTAYTHVTAAVLRAKESVVKQAEVIRENAEDIYDGASVINEDLAKKERMEEIRNARHVLEQAEKDIKEDNDQIKPNHGNDNTTVERD